MEEVIKLDTVVVHDSQEIPKMFKGFQQVREDQFSGMFIDSNNQAFLASISFREEGIVGLRLQSECRSPEMIEYFSWLSFILSDSKK